MIGVEGRYLVKFKIDKFDDFLREEDLVKFLCIEEAGTSLPTWEITFILHDSEIIPYLNEGQVLEYSFGSELDDLTTTEFRILKKTITKSGNAKFSIYLAGIYDAIAYLNDCKIRSFSSVSGIEAIQSVVSETFEPSFQKSTSEDTQTWIQHNIPDIKFISDTWMHSYLNNSIIAVGISTDGKFILKDIIQEIGTEPKWNLSLMDNSSDININGEYVVASDTGFVNQWLGYERSMSIRTIEDGEDSINKPSLISMMAGSPTLDRTNIELNRAAQFGLLNKNVHENYWKAYYQNLSNLLVLSQSRIFLRYSHQMIKDMRILDLVNFEDEDVKLFLLSEEYSGIFLITKIVRKIINKELTTTIEINRDIFGKLIGELR